MISVVVPCLNEEPVLPQLYQRLTAVAASWNEPYEVVAVDDGSVDGTWKRLQEIHARDPRWRIVRFARNFGHQMAVSAGLAYATGDAVIVLDADLQDPPEVLADFLAKWREGYEVVYGVRKKRKESALKRMSYNVFYRLLAAISPTDMPLDAGDFCLMDRRVVDILVAMPEQNRFVRGLRAWVGFHQTGVEYERQSRAAGRPQYGLRRLIRLATDGIFSFSTLPLRLATRAGFLVSTLALLGAVFTFVQRIFADWFAGIGWGPVPGFATIVIGIFFLGGIQLISLGIIGEYIGRIYDEVRGRPLWITRETLGFGDSHPRTAIGPILDRATGRVAPVVRLEGTNAQEPMTNDK